MRYDQGYGRQGGWETRMPDGGRGWDGGYPDPQRGGDPVDRPWVGGYREGYQGGSGGYALRTTGPLYESYGAPPEHERGYRRPRGMDGGRGRQGGGYFVRARAGYGGDFAGNDAGFGELGHLRGGQNAGSGRYGADFGTSRGGYGRDFARGTGGGGYDRGMRGGGGGYDRQMRGGGYDLPFRGGGRPQGLRPGWPGGF